MNAWVNLPAEGVALCASCAEDVPPEAGGYWTCPDCGAEWFPQSDYSEADLEALLATKAIENLP